MKKSTLLLFLLSMATLLPAQKAYFSCDFSQGIPKSFSMYDKDGNTPTSGMKELGFQVGLPWVPLRFNNGNVAAGSTSAYAPAGRSDDWLITPAIQVESENACLTWKAISPVTTAAQQGSYIVYISTTGNQVENFPIESPAYSVAREGSTDFTQYMVPLKEYAGKTIYVAFVNNSLRKNLLAIDDIFVGIPEQFSFTSNIPTYVNDDNEITISGILKAGINSTITSYSIDFYGSPNLHFNKKYEGLNITPNKGHAFTLTDKIPTLEGGKSNTYIMTVTVNGEKRSIKNAVSRPAYQPVQKIVAEEGTGTWCGFCPRGHIAMAALKEKYEDTFIGIAAHVEDPMQINDYASNIGAFFDGYPDVVLNRNANIKGDPGNLEILYNQALNRISIASVQLAGSYSGENSVRVNVSTQFAYDSDQADFRIGLMVTENNVTGYEQVNYYAGGTEDMGGFEKLPDPVPADQMVYQDVARGMIGEFKGFESSIPMVVTQNNPVQFSHTFTIPSNITNRKNMEIIALLIDNKTGQIMNADRISESQLIPLGLECNQTDDTPYINTYRAGDLLTVEVNSVSSDVAISVYDIQGRNVAQSANTGVDGYAKFEIPVEGFNGLYLIKISTGENTWIRKVVLQ